MSIPMASILEALDFEKFEHPLSSMPAYRMHFGPHEVEAVIQMNRWFRQVFMVSGIVNTGRTLGSIELQLPLEVESEEEGLALLGYFLAQQIPERNKPTWLRISERMKFHLPWVKAPSGPAVGVVRREKL
jgi:hypothetical protein